MKSVRHIFFDLDHTLWDTDRNSKESLEELYADMRIGDLGFPSFEDFHRSYLGHNERLWGLYAENKVGRDAVRFQRFIHTFTDFGIHDDASAQNLAIRFMEITPFKKHLIEGTEEILKNLSERFPLYIMTNGFAESQHNKLKAGSIDHFFKEVIISEEVGAHKPDPIIYQHAMKIAGTSEPSECLMVGDTFQTDVLGALNAGWKAVHYTPKGNLHAEPVYSIQTLRELLALLKT